MDLPVLGAELLFIVLFVATFIQWWRRRDPVSRDVALAFSGLALAFVADFTIRVTGAGPMPVPVTAVLLVLLVIQPLATLHLASLIRRVPRRVLVGSTVVYLGAVAGAAAASFVNVQVTRVLAVVALGGYIVIQLLAAAYLLLEARRRRGPGAARFWLAAIATALLALAIIVSLGGSGLVAALGLGTTGSNAVRGVAAVMALAAALGYVAAFLTPRRVQAYWQADTALRHVRDLLGDPDRSVEAIWRQFADLASEVSGARSAVVIAAADGQPGVVATSGFEPPTAERGLDRASVDVETGGTGVRFDTPVGAVDGPIAALAAAADAQFVTTIPLTVASGGAAGTLLLLSQFRSLFRESDADILRSLGAQTAIVAERRGIVAEQADLAQRLAATNESLISASQAKSDFLASMSHELRTPLSAILGFSDLMRQEPAQGENVVVPLEWVELIHRGGQHLLSLINDVLDLAKVEAGRLDLHLEAVELQVAIAELLNGIRPLAERKRLRLDADVPPVTATVDRGRFRQVLYNLLSNAIKYTPDEGSVKVEAVVDGGSIRIAVVDTGIGISADDQPRVFEEFRQVGDPSERQEGTGLGLALTRRLVEAHGGSIGLESVRGKGSTFTVTLPLAGPEGVSVEAAIEQPDIREASVLSGGPVDLLVIEDDPGAVRLLREYLEPAGYQVRLAVDGETGLRMAREHRPSAIILDVLLPGADGWDVLRQLKVAPDTRDVPVVIVTVVDERQVGLALGAVDYLVKPIDRDALLASLARFAIAPQLPGNGRHLRVLAVDDEPTALALIRAALEPEGYEVLEAAGGREALERMRVELVDFVVCDLVMPDVDGFEVIARLKANPETALVPIVVCTAHDISEADKARLSGKILGIVSKGSDAREGLRRWLEQVAPVEGPARLDERGGPG